MTRRVSFLMDCANGTTRGTTPWFLPWSRLRFPVGVPCRPHPVRGLVPPPVRPVAAGPVWGGGEARGGAAAKRNRGLAKCKTPRYSKHVVGSVGSTAWDVDSAVPLKPFYQTAVGRAVSLAVS